MLDFLPSILTENSTSLLGGVLLVVYAAITSLRKRRDLSIAELEKKVKTLEAEKTELEVERDNAEARAEGYQNLMLAARRDVFTLRTLAADHGLTDPTVHRPTTTPPVVPDA